MAELTPANQNPWYVLSTLKGEQTGEEVDAQLAAENVRLWNIWACQHLTEDEHQALRDQGAEVPDAGAWGEHAEEIETLYAAEMTSRNDEGFPIPDLPDPGLQLNLRKMDFKEVISFDGAVIPRGALFTDSVFRKAVSFRGSYFTQYTCFDAVKFFHDAEFSATRWHKGCDYSGAEFAQVARFVGAAFSKPTDFISVAFRQYVIFASAKFQNANFEWTTFEGDARFNDITVDEFAHFRGVSFGKNCNFRGAKFRGNAKFERASVAGRAYFLNTNFGDPDPQSAKEAALDLTDAQFDKPVSFRGARFYNRFPEFRGSILPEQTLFPIDEDAWPETYPVFNEWLEPEPRRLKRTALMREAANSCAVLRNHVKKQGHPEAEHYFFRREMEFMAEIGSPLQRFPYKAFGWVSDYGHSIGRPAGLLAVLWIVPALIYLMYFAWQMTMTGAEFGPLQPFGFSFSNIFKFFGLQRTYFSDFVKELPRWLLTISALQTVFGYILIFFLGLGLRQRFRLR